MNAQLHHSPDLRPLEGGVASWVFPFIEDTATLHHICTHALVVQSLAVRTVAAFHTRLLAAVRLRQVAAGTFTGVATHLVFLATWTLDH